jgi:LysR substrate binding domain
VRSAAFLSAAVRTLWVTHLREPRRPIQEMMRRLAESATFDVLRLGIVHHFGYNFLPVWLSQFKQQWPNLRLITDVGLNAELLKGLEEDRFDLVPEASLALYSRQSPVESLAQRLGSFLIGALEQWQNGVQTAPNQAVRRGSKRSVVPPFRELGVSSDDPSKIIFTEIKHFI